MDEGDKCPACHEGIMEPDEVENCSCHIDPPCSACVDNLMVCSICGYEEGEADE